MPPAIPPWMATPAVPASAIRKTVSSRRPWPATQTDNRLALNLTYDLDFWGRHESEYRAALGEAKASQVDAQAARLLLAANLTRAYVQLDRAYRLQALAEDTRRQREETLKLVAGRVAVGLDSAVELKQAEAAVAAARGDKEAAAEQDRALRPPDRRPPRGQPGPGRQP